MVSDLARGDLEDLRAEGLHPTDEDVIRLHALACRLDSGADTTAACLPRWARVGGVMLNQPTLAAFAWYRTAKPLAADEAMEDWMFAFACAHGRERGYLERLTDAAEIERELGRFIAGCTATADELVRAVCYVTVGFDDAVAAETEMARKLHAAKDERAKRDSYAALEDTMRRAAAATGLTYDDIMIQTPSRLDGMIYEAHVLRGDEMKLNESRLHADYLATLAAIRKRLVAERDAAAEASAATPPAP